MVNNTVYVIAGPTAVGKTSVAIQLAEQLGTSIISADSRQCYQEMSAGTAKPTKEELEAVRHYFINSHSITDDLTAADYEQLATGYLDEIFREHDAAVVCGGTGLYIKALCEGIDVMPPVDKQIEKDISRQYKEQGLSWLQEAVKTEDPAFYEVGEIQNHVRLIRALSFVRSTGESIIKYRTGVKKQRPFRVIKIALELPRNVLYERINRRVDIMMEEGLLEEVRSLYKYRYLKNLQTVGYSELFTYLDGDCTLSEAIDKIKQNTRNYAKRQMTWFRKDKEYHWFNVGDGDIIEKILALK